MNDIILCGKTGVKLEEIQMLLKSMRNIDTTTMYATEAITTKEENENAIIVYVNLDFVETFDSIMYLNSENETLTKSEKENRYRIFVNEVYDYRLMPLIADIKVNVNIDTSVSEIVYKIWEGVKDKI